MNNVFELEEEFSHLAVTSGIKGWETVFYDTKDDLKTSQLTIQC